MEVNADQLLENALRDGIREGVKSKLTATYGSPLEGILKNAIAKHEITLVSMMSDAIGLLVNSESFRDELSAAVRQTLAKQLVQKFGGELEKQVNALKSNPATRARITVAIDEIVKTT